MSRFNQQRIWRFETALEDMAAENAANSINADDQPAELSQHDYRLNAQKMTADLGQVITHTSAQVSKNEIAKHYNVHILSHENDRLKEALSEVRLAEILGRDPKPTRRELHKIRRLLAKQNHPDRVSVSLRKRADREMASLNAMIDIALSESPPDYPA